MDYVVLLHPYNLNDPQTNLCTQHLISTTKQTYRSNTMRIYFDVNCGEKVSPEDLSSLLDKTMDFLTGDQNWLVQSVEDGGILDTHRTKEEE